MEPDHTPVPQGVHRGGRDITRRSLALLLALALAVLGLSGLTTAAAAASANGAPHGVDIDLTFNSSETHNGNVVVKKESVATLTVNYSRDAGPGTSFTVQLPADFPVQRPIDLGTASEDLTVEGPDATNTLKVTFKNPISNPSGVFRLTGKLTEVTNSEVKDFTWSVNGKPNTSKLVFLEDGDSTAPTASTQNKSNAGNPFAGLATVRDGIVSLPASAIGKEVSYTVKGFTTKAVDPYTITDTLPAHMSYVPNSLRQTLTTWDAQGLNKVVGTPTTPAVSVTPGIGTRGESFKHSQAVPANTEVVLTYKAVITDEAGRKYWEQQLQAAWDGLNDDTGGDAKATLTNTATIDGTNKTSTVGFSVNRPRLPRPSIGTGQFNKTIEKPQGLQLVEKPAANGDLQTPISMQYKLSYDLGVFNGQNKYFTLKENVVLQDQLKSGMRFAATLDADLQAQGLAKVATCPTNRTTLAKNTYCVDGQNLYISVGMDATAKGAFTINAQVHNVSALDTFTPSNLPVGQGWKAPNLGRMTYTTEGATNQNVDRWVTTELGYRGDPQDGNNDTNFFTKVTDNVVTVKPGERAKVKYTLTAKATQQYQTARSTIVDHVDRDVFDVPADLQKLKADTKVSYAGIILADADYTITTDADGSLRFALSAAKAAAVANKNAEFRVELTLTTFPLPGKQTIDITNRAVVEGADSEELFWSEKSSSATSFGNVAEIRKRVRDSDAKEWSSNLRVDPASGKKTFVYRVEFLGRGNYGNGDGAKITTVTDKLPAGVTFKGFVNAADADNPVNPTAGPKDLGGNVRASYAGGVVSFTGTGPFVRNPVPAAYFVVELEDSVKPDQPVVNQIGSTSATITKTDGYPLSVIKQDSKDESKVINDPNSRFELLDAQGTPVATGIFVDHGTLKVRTNDGVVGLKVTAPGTYTLRELVPPAGYVRTPVSLDIVVRTDEVPPAKIFANDPISAPQVKVGDYVWIDRNHDGLQDASDVVVPGVELQIRKVGADTTTRTEVTGVNNMPIENVTTNAKGQYLFELLPVLAAGEKYEVTIVNKPAMLDGFDPTKAGTNNGTGDKDSSTNSAVTVKDLTSDGKQDLTLDFGFVKPYVEVGDYVWLDVNRNGTQDAGNDVKLKDVLLALTGPDGKPVTDVYGQPVEPQRTNAEGFYWFTNLPPLAKDDEKYTVTIVTDDERTAEVLDLLMPTIEGSNQGGGDKDSSTGSASNTVDLSLAYAKDPTLDFGFVKKSVQVGNYVWIDENRDGLQDATDTPLNGVVLTITGPDGKPVTDVFGKPVGPQTTKDGGTYLFDNLPALPKGERYTVTIDKVASEAALTRLSPTLKHEGDDEAIDSSVDLELTTKDLYEHGEQDLTLDFGFVRNAVSVGNYLWVDENRDGLQDATDTPLEGVVLKITKVDAEGNELLAEVRDINGAVVDNQTTDATGHYAFTLLPALPAGEHYRVSIVKSAPETVKALQGLIPTTAGVGNDKTIDSSKDFADSHLPLVRDGSEDPTLDFGFQRARVSVGNYVWIDVNRDGLQDATDVKLKGVRLELVGPDGTSVTDVDGNPVEPVATDANGHYEFTDLPLLPEGKHYTVKISQTQPDVDLSVYKPTDAGKGDDKAVDSSTGSATSWRPLDADGLADMTLDFGFQRLAVSVGDYVWEDVDRDGTQDDGEPGIPGVWLEITDPRGNPAKDVDGALVPPVKTGPNGEYEFTNLPPLPAGESYTVSVDTKKSADALEPYVPTTAGADNGSGEKDSSTGSAKSTEDLSQDGAHDPTLDFGFVKKYVTVGDYVWIDVNRDGQQTEGNDVPVPGVELKIQLVTQGVDGETVADVTDVKGNPVGTTLTDGTGRYEFSLLPVLRTGQTYRVSIVRDSLPASLDNFIPTKALQGDDRRVDSEDWVAGTVGDLDGTDVPLKPVRKDEAHVGDDPTLDFGFVEKSVSVGNIVWYDKDEDGKREDGEDPLKGVTLVLTGPDGKPVTDVYGNPVKPAVTDENGHYEFTDLPALPPGEHYTVTVDHEKSPILAELNLVPTSPGERGGDDDPSNDYSHTDSAESKDLTEDGDRDPTLDFGFRKAKVSVGDYVWIDVNRDGLQDSTDIALKGVVLKLTGPDGNPVLDVFGRDVATTTTDGKGFYEFKNLPVLPAGASYTVSIVKDDPRTVAALKGLVVTKAGAGSDTSVDSSTDSAISWMDLSKDGSHDPTLDFGFQRPAVKVGNYVWLDKDRDGKQDKKEPGIEGVSLKLTGPDGKPVRDVNGTIVAPVRTDASGYYEFAELPVLAPGQSYTVTLQKNKSKKALKGLMATVAEKGSNKAVDSSTGTSVSWKDLTVNGAEDMTLDFGFVTGGLGGGNVDNPGGDGDDHTGDPGTGNSTGKPGDQGDTNGSLPETGAPAAGPIILGAFGLLLAGAIALVARRRRES